MTFMSEADYTNVRRGHNGRGAKKSVEHSLRHGAASIIRSQARRVELGEFDVVDLAALNDLHRVVDEALRAAAAGLIAEGASYTEIGRALGISRQAARERFSPAVRQGATAPPA